MERAFNGEHNRMIEAVELTSGYVYVIRLIVARVGDARDKRDG